MQKNDLSHSLKFRKFRKETGLLKRFIPGVVDEDTSIRATRGFTSIFIDTETQINGWVKFYKKVFNIDLSVFDLNIPPRIRGFDRLIIVARTVNLLNTFNGIIGACENYFPVFNVIDLSHKIKSERNAEWDSYAIWVKNDIHASELKRVPSGFLRRMTHCTNTNIEELKDKCSSHTTNIIKNMPRFYHFHTITIEERLLLELKFFLEKSECQDPKEKHLDTCHSATVCAGSTFVNYNDQTPVIWFDGSEVKIDTDRSFNKFYERELFTRQAISTKCSKYTLHEIREINQDDGYAFVTYECEQCGNAYTVEEPRGYLV